MRAYLIGCNDSATKSHRQARRSPRSVKIREGPRRQGTRRTRGAFPFSPAPKAEDPPGRQQILEASEVRWNFFSFQSGHRPRRRPRNSALSSASSASPRIKRLARHPHRACLNPPPRDPEKPMRSPKTVNLPPLSAFKMMHGLAALQNGPGNNRPGKNGAGKPAAFRAGRENWPLHRRPQRTQGTFSSALSSPGKTTRPSLIQTRLSFLRVACGTASILP